MLMGPFAATVRPHEERDTVAWPVPTEKMGTQTTT